MNRLYAKIKKLFKLEVEKQNNFEFAESTRLII